jgi:excisionase family DNA binding protein
MTDHTASTVPTAAERPWVTVAELAAILGVADRTAYEAVRSGQVPAFRIGRQYRIPTAGLRALLGLEDVAASA